MRILVTTQPSSGPSGHLPPRGEGNHGFPSPLGRGKGEGSEVLRILIIQLRRIGDVIVTTPVVDVLRQKFPKARIEFLVEAGMAPVLSHYPGLDEVLVFDKSRFWFWWREIRKRRYDWVLDFMNNPRTAQLTFVSGAPVRAGFVVPFWARVYTHRVPRPHRPIYAVQNKFEILRRLGVPAPEGVLPRLTLTESDFDGARAWWTASGLDTVPQRLAVMPKHRHAIRQWPFEKFREALGLLLQKGSRKAVLVGSPEERSFLLDLARHFPGQAVVVPPGGLRQGAAILSRCDAALTNDSGLMHLAVAVGVPTVTVYGPTSPGSWNPNRPPHRWVQAQGLDCIVCNRDRCPFGHECMEWVSASRVANDVEIVLKK